MKEISFLKPPAKPEVIEAAENGEDKIKANNFMPTIKLPEAEPTKLLFGAPMAPKANVEDSLFGAEVPKDKGLFGDKPVADSGTLFGKAANKESESKPSLFKATGEIE
jgi:hypothetical protein